MRGNIGILMVMAVMCPPCLTTWGMPAVSQEASVSAVPESVIGTLERMSPFAADVDYVVSMPMTEDDVVYKIQLASAEAKADTLSAVDYLIKWALPREDGESAGFLAYFDGHHYRYRDNRLLEYHFEWDSVPFLAGGGVQHTGQFVELLPQSIAMELRRMISSDDYTVSCRDSDMFGGKDVCVIYATQDVKGYVGRNYTLVVDKATCRPIHIENEYNPGQVSEQTVAVSYACPPSDAALAPVTNETDLMAMYPEVFEKFRDSNYRIENMRGLPMPAFSLPTLTGERYSRQKGDTFKAPTLIAVIDPQVASAKATVDILRKVQARMPRQVDLILAFMSNNTDTVEDIVGAPVDGETDLISAKALARDCGTAVYPTLLVVDQSGIVTNVLLGFNNSLEQDVIQALALVR